jgi:arylsulfatase
MDGVSMLYCADAAGAADQHNTQYFEMFGNRAIYHDGWLARVVHMVPWVGKPNMPLQDEEWELYNVAEDFSLVNNIAADNPEKVKEMVAKFEEEAIKNHVYPLDDRLYERFNAAIAGRPDLMGDRTSLTLADGMVGMLENTFINIKNRSKSIEANVSLEGNDRGIILAQGGKFGGWALYMDNGKPAYTYNYFGLQRYTITSDKAITDANAIIKLDFAYDGDGTGKGGIATLYVNGEKVAEGRVEKTQPGVFSADETADVGVDDATQVADLVFKDVEDSEFTGFVDKVTVSISK